MIFHRSMSDSKSPQVSRTLLRILADLKNAVVWMVSISKSSSTLTKPLTTVPSLPITVGVTVIFSYHGFLKFSGRFLVIVSLFLFITFDSVVFQGGRFHYSAGFILIFASFSHQFKLVNLHGSLRDSKSPHIFRTLLSIVGNLYCSNQTFFAHFGSLESLKCSIYEVLYDCKSSSFFFTLGRLSEYGMHTISFQTFFVWTLLLLIHTWNSWPFEVIFSGCNALYRSKNFRKAPWTSSCVSVSVTFFTAFFISSIVS